jgi:hypothetical protein
MACALHVAWDDRLAGYDFGPGHPMAPLQLRLTMELAQALGLGGQDGVTVTIPAAATAAAELELVHDPAFIGMVRPAGRHAAGAWPPGWAASLDGRVWRARRRGFAARPEPAPAGVSPDNDTVELTAPRLAAGTCTVGYLRGATKLGASRPIFSMDE